MKGLLLLALKENWVSFTIILVFILLGTVLALVAVLVEPGENWILMMASSESFLFLTLFSPGAATGSAGRKWGERALPVSRRTFCNYRYLMVAGVSFLWLAITGSALFFARGFSEVFSGAFLVYVVLTPIVLLPLEFLFLGGGKVIFVRVFYLPLFMIPAVSLILSQAPLSFARSWPSYGELLGNFWNLLGLGWLGVVPVLGLASWFLSQLILDRREQ